MNPPALFRFEAATHAYYFEDVQIPSITQMLERTGWIDDRWYTEEASERGTAVHRFTAQHDLGALELTDVPREYRGWVLAYIEMMARLNPTWTQVELPAVHPTLRFGGTPDRVGVVKTVRSVMELKTGGHEAAHAIQTALQTILVAHTTNLPAIAWQRLALYLKQNGRFSLERHNDKRDYDEAHRVLRVCCA